MMQVQAFNCTHANSPVKGRTILKSAAINCRSQVLATILSLDLEPAAGKGKSNRVVRPLGLHHFFHLLYCLCAWDGCAAQRSAVLWETRTQHSCTHKPVPINHTQKLSWSGPENSQWSNAMCSRGFWCFFFFCKNWKTERYSRPTWKEQPVSEPSAEQLSSSALLRTMAAWLQHQTVAEIDFLYTIKFGWWWYLCCWVLAFVSVDLVLRL